MALFKDLLKKWFYTTGTNPEVTASTRVPLLDNSGNPVGSQTSRSFANTIIGNVGLGLQSIDITSDTDLNNLTTEGVYRCPNTTIANSLQNKPSFISVAFHLYVENPTTSNTYQTQVIVASSNQGIWKRSRSTSGTWAQWQRIDGIFDSTATTIPSDSNLNNYTTPGSYKCASQAVAQTISNADFTGGGYILLVFSAYNTAEYVVQFSISHTRVSVRFKLVNNWSSWNLIASNT